MGFDALHVPIFTNFIERELFDKFFHNFPKKTRLLEL